jgi:Ion channel
VTSGSSLARAPPAPERSASQVDAEHLYAALSAYLLSGVCLGLLYWALEEIHPSMFAFTGEFSETSSIYFSFVTLATVGYGDIVPREDVVRGLAILESVGGQLFLAVLVARLVSLYTKPGSPPAKLPQTEGAKANYAPRNDIDPSNLTP